MAFKKITLLFLLAVSLISVFACEKSEKVKDAKRLKGDVIKESGNMPSDVISSDVEKGKALFNDANFAGSSKSCNSCHKNGKRLEKVADSDNLDKAINFCIKTHCKGKPIDPKDKDMAYIIAYIKSLKNK